MTKTKYCTDCDCEIPETDKYYVTDTGDVLCGECICEDDTDNNINVAFVMDRNH